MFFKKWKGQRGESMFSRTYILESKNYIRFLFA